MMTEIKSLDPRARLRSAMAQAIVPDILMRAQPEANGSSTQHETLPRVLVNNRYYARVSRAARNKSEREYPADRLQGSELAGQVAAPARDDDPQGRQRDRPPAGPDVQGRRARPQAPDIARSPMQSACTMPSAG